MFVKRFIDSPDETGPMIQDLKMSALLSWLSPCGFEPIAHDSIYLDIVPTIAFTTANFGFS